MDERARAESGALVLAIAVLYAAFADCPATAQFAIGRHCLATGAPTEQTASKVVPTGPRQ